MSVVSGIVHGHNGAISVDSAEGRGTTFRVLLPVADDAAKDKLCPADRKAEVSLSAVSSVCEQGAILVVDDDGRIRFTLRATLEASGFRVLTAASGDEAMEVLHRNSDAVSLVLLDLTMPGLGTDNTISSIRNTRSNPRIVLMSGHSDRDVATLLKETNVAAYLPKPMKNPVEVIQRVLSQDDPSAEG